MRALRYAALTAGLGTVVVFVSYLTSLGQQTVPDDPRPSALSPADRQPVPDDSVEVQTSGPIHEAFASPLTTDVPESIVVNKQPPEAIEELPPEERPEGSNVVWIPGYFAWDDDQNDFIWMSGFWRDVPPGRVWVSGYWTQADRGWQWVPGFWTAAEQQQVEYLPQPPETVEEGPSIEQPSPDHFWVPGHWSWLGDHYVWRPGYWARVQPDWLWVPAHYVWCPSGYVFVDGFWDLPVIRRGLLFAPVYFRANVYHRPYYFTPSIVWSPVLLTQHLWVRPAYYHYYFGDYYPDRYSSLGIRPWYLSFTFGRTSYDPLFSYYRWYYRDRDWSREVRDRYDYYRRNRDSRPPRTFRDMQQIVARGGSRDVIANIAVAAPITQVVNRRGAGNITAGVLDTNFRTPFRFDRVATTERRQIARQAQELRGVIKQRKQVETRENVARVEAGDRPGAGKAKGEDVRVRRAAPRGLDISNVAQAIGAQTSGRESGTRRGSGRLRDQQAGSDRGAGQVGRFPSADDQGRAKRGDDRRADPGGGKQRGDVAGPDRGPDPMPDLRGKGRGPQGKGLDSRVTTPNIGTDVPRGLPDARGSKGRELRNLGSPTDVKTDTPRIEPTVPGRGSSVDRAGRGRSPAGDRGSSGDRGASGERGPSVDRSPSGDRGPSRGPVERGKGRPDRSESLPSLPGRTEANRVDRPDVPLRRGGADFSALPDAGKNFSEVERGRGAPQRGRSQTGVAESQTQQGPRQNIVREPEIPRGPTRSPLTISPQLSVPRSIDASRAARQPQEAKRETRADPVAPLRLGGPQPSPRSRPTPAPEVRARPELPSAVTRGSGRSTPSAAPPSVRIPTAAPRPREPDDDKKRLRDKK